MHSESVPLPRLDLRVAAHSLVTTTVKLVRLFLISYRCAVPESLGGR